MMCPVKLANEMSGLSGTVSSGMTRCGHEAFSDSAERSSLFVVKESEIYTFPHKLLGEAISMIHAPARLCSTRCGYHFRQGLACNLHFRQWKVPK